MLQLTPLDVEHLTTDSVGRCDGVGDVHLCQSRVGQSQSDDSRCKLEHDPRTFSVERRKGYVGEMGSSNGVVGGNERGVVDQATDT